MQLQDIFKRLGYPKHADRIYTVLNESGEVMSVSAIAGKVRLPRVTVYRCLKVLCRDGVVENTVVGKRTFYSPGSPRKIQQAMRCTEEATAEALARVITDREKDVPRGVRFLKGPAAIKAAFDDVIAHCAHGETFFRYTSEADLSAVNKLLARDYRERRDKKKLERLVISNYPSGSQKRSRLERFIKYIPGELDQFQFNIIQLVYGSRMSIIDLSTEEVTIIENQQLADFQKVIFKSLYKKL